MGTGLTRADRAELTLDSVPNTTFGTRRRRRRHCVMLVYDNYFLEVDAVADCVWRACNGEASVAAIAEAVGSECSLDHGLALAATIAALAVFAEHGIATWARP